MIRKETISSVCVHSFSRCTWVSLESIGQQIFFDYIQDHDHMQLGIFTLNHFIDALLLGRPVACPKWSCSTKQNSWISGSRIASRFLKRHTTMIWTVINLWYRVTIVYACKGTAFADHKKGSQLHANDQLRQYHSSSSTCETHMTCSQLLACCCNNFSSCPIRCKCNLRGWDSADRSVTNS